MKTADKKEEGFKQAHVSHEYTLSHYRGYRVVRSKVKDNFTCTYTYENSNYHMPRKFVWASVTHMRELHAFIDALCERDILAFKQYENAGLVNDLVYEDPPSDVKIIHISPHRLMAVLRGEDTLEVPATSKLRFCSKTGTHYPTEFFSELVSDKSTEQYFATINQRVAQGRPIICFNGVVPKFLNPRFKVIPADIQLQQAEAVLAGSAKAAVSSEQGDDFTTPEADEVLISENTHDTHTELVILTTRQGEAPFFTRRLIRKGIVLWSGTSYHGQGPWTVYSADKTRLAALGITP